jgi:hypothetical protein
MIQREREICFVPQLEQKTLFPLSCAPQLKQNIAGLSTTPGDCGGGAGEAGGAIVAWLPVRIRTRLSTEGWVLDKRSSQVSLMGSNYQSA